MTEALRVTQSDIDWLRSLGIPEATAGVEALLRDGEVIVEQMGGHNASKNTRN